MGASKYRSLPQSSQKNSRNSELLTAKFAKKISQISQRKLVDSLALCFFALCLALRALRILRVLCG
jgi:hypothetical protein